MKFPKFLFVLCSVWIAFQYIYAHPTRIIIDTDMGNDIDDALALSILYNYQKRGDADTAAVLVNKGNKFAPIFCVNLNAYYGFDSIAVGFTKDGKTPESGAFIQKISELKAKTQAQNNEYQNASFPDSVKLARKVLAESDDNSVVYISLGFLTNAARLLESQPDEISPLSGMQLAAKKIKYFSVMGGDFTNPKYCEYNIKVDVASAQKFVESCPVKIVFSGFEIGIALPFPHSAVDKKISDDNPIKPAYNLFAKAVDKTGRHDRPTWDLTSVLYVFEPQLFAISESGKVKVSDKGSTSFIPYANGNSYYLKLPKDAESKIIEMLVKKAAY